MHYLSLRHCTANGDEEITIVRLAGLLEWSAMMLKSGTTNVGREVTECYIADRKQQWRNKATGEVPGREKQLELFEIKCSMQANSAAMDRMK